MSETKVLNRLIRVDFAIPGGGEDNATVGKSGCTLHAARLNAELQPVECKPNETPMVVLIRKRIPVGNNFVIQQQVIPLANCRLTYGE